MRWQGRDPITPVQRAGQQLIGGNDLVDQAELGGAPGVELLATDVELKRAAVAQRARERPARAHLGNEPQSSERGHEHGILGDQSQVTRQGKGQADPRGGTVDGGNERGVRAGDQPNEGAEALAYPLVGHEGALLVIGSTHPLDRRLHHAQIAAGGERLTRTREDHRANRRVGDQLLDVPLQLDHQRRGQDIALLRVAQANDGPIAETLHLHKIALERVGLPDDVGVAIGVGQGSSSAVGLNWLWSAVRSV